MLPGLTDMFRNDSSLLKTQSLKTSLREPFQQPALEHTTKKNFTTEPYRTVLLLILITDKKIEQERWKIISAVCQAE